MRSHPVAGSTFLLAGVGLLALGAWGVPAPGFLAKAPLPASVLMTFMLWQLAVWCLFFGLFFLRPRGRAAPRAFARATLRP